MDDDDYQKIVDSRHYYSHLLPSGKRVMSYKVRIYIIWTSNKEEFCCVVC